MRSKKNSALAGPERLGHHPARAAFIARVAVDEVFHVHPPADAGAAQRHRLAAGSDDFSISYFQSFHASPLGWVASYEGRSDDIRVSAWVGHGEDGFIKVLGHGFHRGLNVAFDQGFEQLLMRALDALQLQSCLPAALQPGGDGVAQCIADRTRPAKPSCVLCEAAAMRRWNSTSRRV